MTERTIDQARVTFTGGVDPAIAGDAVTGAMTSLASAPLPTRGHRSDLRVEVRVASGQPLTADALARAIDAAIRREVAG